MGKENRHDFTHMLHKETRQTTELKEISSVFAGVDDTSHQKVLEWWRGVLKSQLQLCALCLYSPKESRFSENANWSFIPKNGDYRPNIHGKL